MSFLSLLTILFIGLKLTGFIDWSWWLVLLPFYSPFALEACVGLVIVLMGLISGLIVVLVGLISGKKPRLTLTHKGKRIW